MAEWSIAAVLKTVVLRGTGGSNPSLSARPRSKKVSRNRYLLFLYLWRKFTCRRRCGNKRCRLAAFAQWACKGPCGKQKGKALSGATIGSVVVNPPSPLDHNAERMTKVIRFVFFLCLLVCKLVASKPSSPSPSHKIIGAFILRYKENGLYL